MHRLEGVPQSSIGAPLPLVLADESTALVAFCLENRDQSWDGSTVRVVDPVTSEEPIGIVRFTRCYSISFGPPNDDAFSGHPLAARGLEPYGAFRIEQSSWLLELERRNSVHPRHDRDDFLRRKQHLILTFHDSIVEWIAESFDVSYERGSLHSVLPVMLSFLRTAA